jgi:uncharacterized RDD family membrane protein YckC
MYWMAQGDRVIQADGNGESLRAIFTRAWLWSDALVAAGFLAVPLFCR